MMEIGPLSTQPSGQRPEEPKKPAPQASEPDTAHKGDRVEISREARAKLAELADLELKKEASSPTPVKDENLTGHGLIEAIRSRIESGFYERNDVRGRIADKLIDDLE